MTRCAQCGWKYPEDLVSPFVVSGAPSRLVCGICVEELRGFALRGEMASRMRDDAEDWRHYHPESAPKVGAI